MSTKRLPDFVIIGAAKSASTWLHMALRQHPDIHMSASEAPFFLGPYYNGEDISSLHKSTNSARPGAIVGIKCPNYLCTEECAPRLAKHLPGARLIAVVRNPVDRALSQYYHLIRSGRLPLVPADVAFSRYLGGQFDPPYTKHQILEAGLYAQGIANYLQVFPKEQLLVMTGLDMRSDLHSVFKRACRFLGVADTFVPANITLPRNQGAYSVPFLSLIMWLNQRGIAFDAKTGLDHPHHTLVGWAARGLAIQASRLSAASRLFVRDQKPVVSLKTRSDLLDYYMPDILKLEKMMQVDLTDWKLSPRA